MNDELDQETIDEITKSILNDTDIGTFGKAVGLNVGAMNEIMRNSFQESVDEAVADLPELPKDYGTW